MKIVCISDTHNYYPEVPDGDVLVHAGDITMVGKYSRLREFNDWLGTLPHKHKLIIAGNHDLSFEDDTEKAESIITNGTYLCDKDVVIDGVKFWGSPWQPWFNDWAFNVPRGSNSLKAVWDKIPDDTDVLITHGPPYGILDRTLEGDLVGCDLLLARVKEVKPKFHIFGHIHEEYGVTVRDGTTFINASIMNREYKPGNSAIVAGIEN